VTITLTRHRFISIVTSRLGGLVDRALAPSVEGDQVKSKTRLVSFNQPLVGSARLRRGLNETSLVFYLTWPSTLVERD